MYSFHFVVVLVHVLYFFVGLYIFLSKLFNYLFSLPEMGTLVCEISSDLTGMILNSTIQFRTGIVLVTTSMCCNCRMFGLLVQQRNVLLMLVWQFFCLSFCTQQSRNHSQNGLLLLYVKLPSDFCKPAERHGNL